jgi:hypothetical protein
LLLLVVAVQLHQVAVAAVAVVQVEFVAQFKRQAVVGLYQALYL